MKDYRRQNLKYPIMSEIKYQKKAWESTINQLSNMDEKLLDVFKNHENFYFIGCGSSYNAGIIASFLYDMLFDKKSVSVTSSDFLFYPDNYIKENSSRNVFFLISRTGGTTETLYVLDMLKKIKGHTVALTTFPKSRLAEECDYSIVLEESKEESITATKSMTSAIIAFFNIFLKFAGKESYIEKILYSSKKFFKSFDNYSDTISSIVEREDFNRFVFLGSGLFYGVAKEAELKVREMSITNTEFCQPLEYRHGHNSILDENSLVVLFLSDAGSEYEVAAAREFRKIGAKVLIICDNKKLNDSEDSYDYLININLDLEEMLRPVFYQIFGQLLGYHQAINKDIDPSNPRNLEYCVTF